MSQLEFSFPVDETPKGDDPTETSPTTLTASKRKSGRKRKKAASKRKTAKQAKTANRKSRVERPFPRVPLQEAIKVPLAIRHKNGGNPMVPDLVREAVGSAKGNAFFYLSASSRDFGLTEGTRDADEISLTEAGRQLAYAENTDEEKQAQHDAFLRIPIFKQVLEHYAGDNLPEMKYLKNTLEGKFDLHPDVHEEFAELFRKNCEFLGIREGGVSSAAPTSESTASARASSAPSVTGDFVTVAEPESDSGLVCFVAMPFTEKTDKYPKGFFSEVLRQIIAPAGRKAGFRVITARKTGSDVIHATIINGLLDADLVVADLTEHNPNVLFELGVRMAEDKPVALIRADGTKPIFDVDHVLRVEDYNPCLWPSTLETDLPRITDHIAGAWSNREDGQSYMKLLRSKISS